MGSESNSWILVTAIYLAMAGSFLRADTEENGKPIDTCIQLVDAVRRNDWGVVYDLSTESDRIIMVADNFVRLGGRYDSNPKDFDQILLKYYDRDAATEALNKLAPDATAKDRLRAIVSTIRNPKAFVKECYTDALRTAELRGKVLPELDIRPEDLDVVITGDTALATQGYNNIRLKLEAGKWRLSGHWNLHRPELK